LQFPSRSDTLPVTVQYDSDSNASDESSTTSSQEHSQSDRKHHKHNSGSNKLHTTLLRPLSGFGDAWRLMTTGNSTSHSTSNQQAAHDSDQADNRTSEIVDTDEQADSTTATASTSHAVLQTSKTCVIS
jgi:hypothetical protein